MTLPIRAPETASLRLADGTRLDATIWRPAGEGRFPVLLMRQPYGRAIASTVVHAHPAWYAAQGFAVVIQDVRGSGTSEGDFLPYSNEAGDGAETIAWAASLPFCDGQVGMYGFSYQGAAQTLALSRSPPALRAIAPAMALWDLHAERIEPFKLAGNAMWAAQMGAMVARRAADPAAHAELAVAGNSLAFNEGLPASPAVLRRHAALNHYAQWHAAPAEDAYFTRASSARLIGHAQAPPAMFTGGWFDYHLTGTVAGHKALGGHLVIGPWTHLGWSRHGAGADFGAAADGRIDAMQAGFFAHALKGEAPPAWMEAGRVQLFDLGARQWRVFPAWPDGPRQILHLGGGGLAAATAYDGTLGESAGVAGTDHVVHDPWRPAPAFGLDHGGPAWADRAAIDARCDIACFTTAPYPAPVTYAGDAAAVIAIDTDAASFDIAATLSLVTRDGRVMAVSHGHARIQASSTPEGGQRIALRPLCLTVAAGECLRLSLAGACFPAYPVNPGTGTDPRHATAAEARPITLAIRYGGTAGSRLELPLAEA